MFEVDPSSDAPIYRQIVDGVRLDVAAGRFAPGDELPSVRRMAQRLRINPNTVARAFRELESLGVIETRRGAGSFVARDAVESARDARTRLVRDRTTELVTAARGAGLSDKEILNLVRETRAEATGRTHERFRDRPQ